MKRRIVGVLFVFVLLVAACVRSQTNDYELVHGGISGGGEPASGDGYSVIGTISHMNSIATGSDYSVSNGLLIASRMQIVR